nr:hypothetical protein [uncultured Glaciecola sp.]
MKKLLFATSILAASSVGLVNAQEPATSVDTITVKGKYVKPITVAVPAEVDFGDIYDGASFSEAVAATISGAMNETVLVTVGLIANSALSVTSSSPSSITFAAEPIVYNFAVNLTGDTKIAAFTQEIVTITVEYTSIV